jgi:hypothetical protein
LETLEPLRRKGGRKFLKLEEYEGLVQELTSIALFERPLWQNVKTTEGGDVVRIDLHWEGERVMKLLRMALS